VEVPPIGGRYRHRWLAGHGGSKGGSQASPNITFVNPLDSYLKA
jgi:hypothetical protein